MNKLMNKMIGYETETIKEIVTENNNNFNEGIDLIIETGLTILEERMTEDSFISFCDKLL